MIYFTKYFVFKDYESYAYKLTEKYVCFILFRLYFCTMKIKIGYKPIISYCWLINSNP